MPIYDYKCDRTDEVIEKFAGYEQKTMGCACGGTLKRQFSTNYAAISDIEPYLDEHIGSQPRWIKSRKHREQVMKQEKVYEAYGRGWV